MTADEYTERGVPSGTEHRTTAKPVRLLSADRAFGARLQGEQVHRAESELVVLAERLDRGPWRPRGSRPTPNHLGYLVLDGLLTREVLVPGGASVELSGPGDLLQPWLDEAASFCATRWRVLQRAALAGLDDRVVARLSRYPSLIAELNERAARPSRALALQVAIASEVGVKTRLLVLFWSLAERFGRVLRGNVLVPLPLTHATIARMLGAQRSSVSVALSALAREGTLRRTRRDRWLLSGEPPTAPAPAGPAKQDWEVAVCA